MANIKKIKLSDGNIYSIFDNGALRLDENGKLITGNTVVDKVILDGNLFITEIDDVPLSDSIENVLVAMRVNVGTTEAPIYSNKIEKRSIDQLLEDIGGYSAAWDTGTLSLKLGK